MSYDAVLMCNFYEPQTSSYRFNQYLEPHLKSIYIYVYIYIYIDMGALISLEELVLLAIIVV